MALVKLGGLISDIRGSVGGNVFTRNKSGAVVRQRTTPINPKTALQSAVRAIMALVSASWALSTSAAQKAAWAVFAANVPAKNKLGEDIRLSGFNQFQKTNTVAQYAGLPEILDAPAQFTLPGEDPTFAVVISEATQDIAVTFDATQPWAIADGGALIIRMGLPQDDSITFFDGPWRNTDPILGAVIPPVTGDAVPVSFPVVAGQQIFVEAKIMDPDGRVTDWFRGIAIAGA